MLRNVDTHTSLSFKPNVVNQDLARQRQYPGFILLVPFLSHCQQVEYADSESTRR